MSGEKKWKVYLALCSDNTCYCGITTDLDRRLAQHNGQLPGGARYTARRRPVNIYGVIDATGRSQALKLEAMIKKLPRSKKIDLFTANDTDRCHHLT